MKRIIWFVIVVGVILGGITLYKPKTIEYVKGDTVTEVKEVNHLDEQIKAKEDELDEKYTKIKNLEAHLSVNEAEIKRLQTENVELRKELSTFTIGTP